MANKVPDNESFEERAERGRNVEGDAGASEVDERMNDAAEKGYFGIVTDPTPNENYSLETGQDAPTPETDADLFDEARDAALGHPLRDIELTAAERVARAGGDSEPGGSKEGGDE
jgi:hypothetical protein